MPTGLKRATIDTEIAVYGNVPTTETSATILDRRALETGTQNHSRVPVSNFLGLKTLTFRTAKNELSLATLKVLQAVSCVQWLFFHFLCLSIRRLDTILNTFLIRR